MNTPEEKIRQSLILRLLNLGYPKSSIILELGLAAGRNNRARVDLAISDPETNKILAVFEVKNSSKDLSVAVQQVTSYANMVSDNILAFVYTSNGDAEEIYSVDTKNNIVSQVYDLPDFKYLKSSYSSPTKEKINKLKKQKNIVTTWSNIVAGMSSSIAIAVTVAMATGLFFSENKTLNNGELTAKIISLETNKRKLELRLSTFKSELSQVKNTLVSVSSLPEGVAWKTEASKMQTRITVIYDKLSALENALTVDPAKALAVPILRKDLDNVEKNLKAELHQTRLEIDRMYDQNKWFIGLMFTIALSVLGMAASSFLNKKDT